MLVVVALVLGGCGTTKYPAELTFSYQALAEPGFTDQNVQIVNRGSSAVVPVLAYQPTDAKGRDLTGIKVTAICGSDRGELVIPEGGGYEILAFEGDGVSEVIDVRVTILSVEPVKYNLVDFGKDLRVHTLDSAGEPVYGATFDSVRLTNDGPLSFTVRLVYLVLDNPPPEKPQQAIRIEPLAGPTKVMGRSQVVVPLTSEVARIHAETAGQDVSWSIRPCPTQ